MRRMYRIFFFILCCFTFSLTYAAVSPEPLSPDQAFQFTTELDANNQVFLEWRIAPDHYLYRNDIHVTVTPMSQIKDAKVQLPQGILKKDDVLGTYQVFSGVLKVPVLLPKAASGMLNLNVSYQGCSSKGYCYPPIKNVVRVTLGAGPIHNNVFVTSDVPPSKISDQNYAETIFAGSSNLIIILSFLGLGLLLAFTPCVLPMIPILSGIIVGHGKHLTTMKAFLLSLVYVMGMALTYAAAGVIVALIGSRIQTLFQTTWVIVLVSGLFVLLALSLFGFYELEEPARWRNFFTSWSNKQKGGTYLGAFLMGVLSSLIVSPCVSAPLVGVLAYIAQTGNTVLGGFALLALGFGMGIPLLLVGISAGKLLPKAGPWMESVKKLFGILLLAIAIWMLSRVIPGPVALFLWAVLLICTAIFMGIFNEAKNNWYKLLRGLSVVLVVYGIILVIGAALGNSDPLHPWEKIGINNNLNANNKDYPSFIIVKDMTQLENELAAAKSLNKPVLLDFYADWCVSCVHLDRYVFALPIVQKQLQNFVLLRADVTRNNNFDRGLLKKMNVIAPPTLIFFNNKGQELKSERMVGEFDQKDFLQHLQQLDLVQI